MWDKNLVINIIGIFKDNYFWFIECWVFKMFSGILYIIKIFNKDNKWLLMFGVFCLLVFIYI